MRSTSSPDVLVIGATIGSLAAAVALAPKGIAVRLYERSADAAGRAQACRRPQLHPHPA
jgi:phytoene dehydrogenase-like protein